MKMLLLTGDDIGPAVGTEIWHHADVVLVCYPTGRVDVVRNTYGPLNFQVGAGFVGAIEGIKGALKLP